MENQFMRTELLLGREAVFKLKNSRVAVFGLGGVGGHVCDALVRAGVGAIDIVDNDVVSLSNINRQLIALHSTIGMRKTDVMERHLLDINPELKVNKHDCFFLPETSGEFSFEDYDYVVDAIDTVTAKIELIMKCRETNTPIICSMGTGNKLNPMMLKVSDISKTSVCPLAKVMRRELKKRGVNKLKVVYSEETPVTPEDTTGAETKGNTGRVAPGSISFVPSVAGLILAREVILDITSQ